MPPGIYEHKHRGGRPPSCFCGTCRKCKRRAWDATYYKKTKVTDEELEAKLDKYFAAQRERDTNIHTVRGLSDVGHSTRDIERLTGIPRSTIQRYRKDSCLKVTNSSPEQRTQIAQPVAKAPYTTSRNGSDSIHSRVTDSPRNQDGPAL
jgi:hypothetical protein